MPLRPSIALVALAMYAVAALAAAADSVNPRDIIYGVVPKDAIPALVLPSFVPAADAGFMRPNDRVIAIEANGVERAYPTRILDHHEIVDDVIGDKPVVVTYCPLCGSAVAFSPLVNGRVLTFGVSGDLYDSNLLMYDRQTNSLWLQVSGEAVQGKLQGAKLAMYPVAYDTWAHWKDHHPAGAVLSIHTGYEERFGNYEKSPYQGYASTPDLWFYVNRDDKRLPRKTRVIGVEAHGAYKAYPEDIVWQRSVIEDDIGATGVVILADRGSSRVGAFERGDLHLTLNNGTVSDQRGRRWTWAGNSLSLAGQRLLSFEIVPTFWFAWSAIHPDTALAGR